jgi:MarR family transcriptional regulator, organic hydroperoxide resistance regulator
MANRAGLHLTDMQCLNLMEFLGPVTPGKLAECTDSW